MKKQGTYAHHTMLLSSGRVYIYQICTLVGDRVTRSIADDIIRSLDHFFRCSSLSTFGIRSEGYGCEEDMLESLVRP